MGDKIFSLLNNLSGNRGRIWDVRCQTLDVWGEVSDIIYFITDIRDEISEMKCQRGDVRYEVSGLRCQSLDIRNDIFLFDFPISGCPLLAFQFWPPFFGSPLF